MADSQPVQFEKSRSDKKQKHTWGSSETLASGPGFQTVRLTVSPLQAISPQWHRHRDQQWVVARGTARAVMDGKEQTLGRGQALNIPRTVEHSVANMSSVDPLEIMEIQTGDYLGEDDVVVQNEISSGVETEINPID